MKLNLDRKSAVPLVEQIVGQIRLLIQSGRLRPDQRLPTGKEVAAEVGVNPNTVAAAYRTLERDGYLVQRTRAGTRVAPRPPEDPEQTLALHLSAEFAKRAQPFSLDLHELLALTEAQARLRVDAPPLQVAVLAGTPLQAAALAERCAALFGERVRCVPQLLTHYERATYPLTVVHPELLLELREAQARQSLPLYGAAWVHDHEVPAGAD